MIATKIIKKHSDYKQLFINIFLVVLIIGVAITIIIIVINSSGPIHGPGPCKPGISYNELTGQNVCLACKPELECKYGVESKCNTKRNTICKLKPPGPTSGPKPGPKPGPGPPDPPPLSACGVNDGDISPECTTKAGKDSSSPHCSVCKYGWFNYNDSDRCCSKEENDNQAATGRPCIMNCLGQDIYGTPTGNCENVYYGLTFPTDDCPKANRGVLCDTRSNTSPNCSFCDLGYIQPAWNFNDYCCTEEDVKNGGCITSCKYKCKYGSNKGICPYFSSENCPGT